MKINDKKAIEFFKEYLKSNMLREKIKIDDELYYSDYGIANNPFLMNNHTLYKTVNRNLIEEETNTLINQFNKQELFEVVYFSTLEGLYNTENYYICYNSEERRFESFDNLECIKQVEEFKTLLNTMKRGEKHE